MIWRPFSLLLLLVFCLVSCDNEVDFIEERDDKPIVYGFLNSQDTTQYIRVEKSFVDPNTGAVILAKDENQVYFSDATVTLDEVGSSNSWVLDRVDVSQIPGFERAEGDFLTNPNYMYRLDNNLLEESKAYQLTVNSESGAFQDATATATVLRAPSLKRPNSSTHKILDFATKPVFEIEWRRRDGVALTNVIVHIKVKEDYFDTGESVEKDIEWPALVNAKSPSGNTRPIFSADGSGFFGTLAAELDPIENGRRQFLGLEFEVIHFDEEYAKYVEVLSSNSGITGAQEVPIYSNVNNGLGLFSSSSSQIVGGMSITPVTRDSLFNGSITGDLGFTF